MQFIVYVVILVVAVFSVGLEWDALASPSMKISNEMQAVSHLGKPQSAPAAAAREPVTSVAKQTDKPQVVAPGLGDDARRKQSDALSAQSESEFLRCFDAHAQEQKGFAAAARAAQALLMRLPAR